MMLRHVIHAATLGVFVACAVFPTARAADQSLPVRPAINQRGCRCGHRTYEPNVVDQ